MNNKIRQEAMHIHNWCTEQCDCVHCDFGRDNRTCKISGIPAQWFDDEDHSADDGKKYDTPTDTPTDTVAPTDAPTASGKTRQERFLEMFPHTVRIMADDAIDLCPGRLGERRRCPADYDCRKCKREFWFTKEDSHD
mgnify:CR=1 FL=1|jgi:hypothetical protein